MYSQHRYCKYTFNQNGNRSDRVLFRENPKDEEMAPPVPDSEIPCGAHSIAGGFLCKARDLVAISVIMTLAALCMSLSNKDADVPYSLTNNWWSLVGSIISLSVFNLTMTCGTVALFRNKFIWLALYAAAQWFTRPFCISLALNIPGLINGEYDKDEYIMAFLCLILDVISITLFIISLCNTIGSDDNYRDSDRDSDRDYDSD